MTTDGNPWYAAIQEKKMSEVNIYKDLLVDTSKIKKGKKKKKKSVEWEDGLPPYQSMTDPVPVPRSVSKKRSTKPVDACSAMRRHDPRYMSLADYIDKELEERLNAG